MAVAERRWGALRRRWIGVLAASAVSLGALLVAVPPASARSCLLVLYQNTDGTPGWTATDIGGGLAPQCGSRPAIVRLPGGTEIATVAFDGSIWFYWNADGTPGWGSSEVAGPGVVTGPPAMTRTSGSTEIASVNVGPA